MLNILLIADQPRLQKILATAGDIPDCTLRIANNLAKGQEEIASTPPQLLFVQSRLSGLSAGIITRHIRNQPQIGAAKIILFTDPSEASSSDNLTDITLDLAVPDSELLDAATEIISEFLTANIALPSAPASINSTNKSPDTPSIPNEITVPTVSDQVSLATRPSIASAEVIKKELSSPPGSASPLAESLNPTQEPTFTTGQKSTGAAHLPDSRPPLQWEKQRIWLASLLILTMIGGGLFVFYIQQRTPQTKAPPKASTAVSVPPNTVKKLPEQEPKTLPLPGFIPRETLDPKYSLAHPGWERYLTAEAEYKVFRDKAKLKALQVIDKSGTGLSPRFFTNILQELTGARDYRLSSKERKDAFLIKNGKLPGNARIIIYKNASDDVLQAFVIYYP